MFTSGRNFLVLDELPFCANAGGIFQPEEPHSTKFGL